MPSSSRSPFFMPAFLAAAIVLSSCVSSIVQSTLIPQSRPAAYASSPAAYAAVRALYAHGTSTFSTTSSTDQPIPGMTLTLPPASTTAKNALVTFNALFVYPQPYCQFVIYTGTTRSVYAPQGSTNGATTYAPANIVLQIPLTSSTQAITVDANNAGTGTCSFTEYYSVSALITN